MNIRTLPLLLLAAVASTAAAQSVVSSDCDSLVVNYRTPSFTVESRLLEGREYPLLTAEGYHPGGQIGAPALPTLASTIEIPFCSAIEVEVRNPQYDTIDLQGGTPWPLQPSRLKTPGAHRPARLDTALYRTDAYWGTSLAAVQDLGIARDRRLALLTFSPLRINPVQRKAILCRSAQVVVRYRDADAQATATHYSRYHTPAFSHLSTLNSLPTSKDATARVPVRMVVVMGDINGVASCHSLQKFVQWKRTQGMIVDIIDASQISTPQEVADSLTLMYAHATEERPAPTFVLLLGDHQQLPAFQSRLSNDNEVLLDILAANESRSYSDYYYTTWTSDNLPDAYLGRFSAADTATLANIIEKTLLYEQYAFSDDSYLAAAALVSGVDYGTSGSLSYDLVNDAGYIYSDPTMDYLARHYFNAANGYSQVNYYKNHTAYAPAGVTVTGSSQSYGTANALRSRYDEGMGVIAYSAHGYVGSWYSPQFNKSNANNMQNSGKPSMVFANCCLSSQFHNTTCLGEAMTRRGDNAGAVAYIGGVNLTYWENDFHWAIGVRNNISATMNTDYNSQRLGSFDQMFHTHGETAAKRASTAAAMMYAGLMAVNSTASYDSWHRDMADYYWEVYELLGDPSLLPWLGRAADMPLTLEQQGSCLRLATAPYAYVAVVDSATMTPLTAAFADQYGNLCLDIDPSNCPPAFFTITAAGHKPLQRPLSQVPVGIGEVPSQVLSLFPNPATDRVTVEAPRMQRIEVIDIAGRPLISRKASGDRMEIALGHLPSGLYWVRVQMADTVEIKKLIINNN